MTTDHTTEADTTAPRTSTAGAPPLPLSPDPYTSRKLGRILVGAGAVISFASTMLAWTWTAEFPGDLTVAFYPAGLQLLTVAASILTATLLLAGAGVRGLRWLTPGGKHSALLLMTLANLAATWYTAGAIAVELGGLANFEPGMWIGVAGTLLALVGALALPTDLPPADPGLTEERSNPWKRLVHALKAPAPGAPAPLPGWAEILVICASCALGLYVFAYGIEAEDGPPFIGFLLLVAFAAPALGRAGLTRRLSAIAAKHRNVTLAAAFVAALLFPITQSNEAYTNIAVSVLIFATVALGLNMVVGLAGILDLGYVAFLGVGAYTAALVSGADTSPLGFHVPFWAAVLLGAGVALVFGLIIGFPSLRLHGDYLAIVTLGFGEIFRISVQNLDGDSGPNVTNGPNGVPNIPDLEIFGFNLGEPHTILGFELGRFANYYLLMLVFTAIVVTIFRRSDNSRIGRAWIAIREDETAARAMGVNAFRLKLMAFALGATLAGMAGTVLAHVEFSVNPESYKFVHTAPPNSAFLLIAVILGGMGTVTGPLIGAALLYLIPAKLQFMADYQLLLFGIALILLMRFRPEGLIADRRKQLEFHETGQLDVPTATTPGLSKTEA
ncbi:MULTISPECIES: branched-chain amino acid ABC transporter permease [unclassified Streptomyces]|uniref:branched-chain amino acid ABC transporter permease n=1 Tax=unclassified Streptomyces TaxID=2593676 RepID=UPI002DDC6151|nr:MULTISPECIES: branched-chain amino acid ABC transporter permease [unclassified Streptomyces]WSA95561.1 branched-chain amino acid ABC transporter permease [Streptomyces sp. NBC_01795]WSB79975.1 branched-chain amino acid ABC transporter permease [Streptomyces sp. NBC_01775]WSS11817.1 branched-chain amino acid ABC transporter permease [Streptomyces sp. NBC_01186]WSS40530.1 branched-chain amino acid ABC transporter permease [Streptomyces sp. NBC_01187]